MLYDFLDCSAGGAWWWFKTIFDHLKVMCDVSKREQFVRYIIRSLVVRENLEARLGLCQVRIYLLSHQIPPPSRQGSENSEPGPRILNVSEHGTPEYKPQTRA